VSNLDRGAVPYRCGRYLSFRLTIRLKTGAPGFESASSAMKYPLRTNWKRSRRGGREGGFDETPLKHLDGGQVQKVLERLPFRHVLGIGDGEETVVQPDLGRNRVRRRHPLDCRRLLPVALGRRSERLRSYEQRSSPPRGGRVADDLVAPEEVAPIRRTSPPGRRRRQSAGGSTEKSVRSMRISRVNGTVRVPSFPASFGQRGISSRSTRSSGQFVIVALRGRRTAIARGARAFRSSRIASSSRSMLTRLFALSTPMRAAKRRIPSGA